MLKFFRKSDKNLIKRIVIAIILSVICAVPMIVIATQTRLVTVIDGDKSVTVMTAKKDAADIAALAGLPLDPFDNVTETHEGGMNATLEIERAGRITVFVDNRQMEIPLMNGHVIDALLSLDVSITSRDKCYPSPSTELKSGMVIVVTHAMEVSFAVDGNSFSMYFYGGNVSNAIASAKLSLSADDICNHSQSAILTDGMEIKIDRVVYQEVTTKEAIPFETEYKTNTQWFKDIERVSQKGVDGEKTTVTREKYINGELVSTEVISEKVTKKAVNKIISKGTKDYPVVEVNKQTTDLEPSYGGGGTEDVPLSASWKATIKSDGTVIDHLGNVVDYQTVVTGKGTAYYTNVVSGTSTGRLAQYGVVAINPKVIPYGTIMYICSTDGSIVYGYAVAGDTGGTLERGSVLVDLFYDSYEQCCWYGTHQMNLYILK